MSLQPPMHKTFTFLERYSPFGPLPCEIAAMAEEDEDGIVHEDVLLVALYNWPAKLRRDLDTKRLAPGLEVLSQCDVKDGHTTIAPEIFRFSDQAFHNPDSSRIELELVLGNALADAVLTLLNEKDLTLRIDPEFWYEKGGLYESIQRRFTEQAGFTWHEMSTTDRAMFHSYFSKYLTWLTDSTDVSSEESQEAISWVGTCRDTFQRIHG